MAVKFFRRERLIPNLVLLAIALSFFWSTIFMVNQRDTVIIFGLGEVKRIVSEPGLNFKLPRPFETAYVLDQRIQTIDAADSDRFITAEKKNILIDSFVKWRIADPRLFFISFSGDRARAEDRLLQIVKAALNEEVTKRTVNQVIASDRALLMTAISKKVADESANVGIKVVDVRLKSVNYIESINSSVYDRMKAERNRVANELRSIGSAEGEKIRANADRQREEILATAYKTAQKIMGEADAKASRMYAQSFGKNPDFYQFTKSLEGYRTTFKNKQDIIVTDQNSSFFKFMQGPNGTK